MKQISTILSSFINAASTGLTRAELCYVMFGTNEQHRVCRDVLELIKLGLLTETKERRANPFHPNSKGRVIVITEETK